MKIPVITILLAAVLCAQAPKGPITADTVVANIAGKDVTAADLEKSMRNWSPEQLKQFYANPVPMLQTMFTYRYLAAEAEKLHLGDVEPWKSQIDYAREGIMGQAMANHERNMFPVSEQDTEAFYNANKAKYEESKIKVIMLGFLEPIPVGTTVAATQDAAKVAVQNQHARNKRSEQDALTLAADIVAKLRKGADFVAMVKQYSDDDSKTEGGDYGTVSPTSSFPDEIKKAVLALKPGETSDPVRMPNALYIIRVTERTAIPVDQVRAAIIDEIRNNHLQQFGNDLQKKFKPTIVRPEFFLPSGPPPK